jgi:tetratricopeptide (TPR) repeat protein
MKKEMLLSGLLLGVTLVFATGFAFGWQKDSVDKTRVNEFASEMLMDKASRAFEERDINKAMRLFKASIKYNGKNAEAYYRLGVAYAYLREFKKAIPNFRQAIKLSPEYAKAYLNLGSAYGQLKNYKKALGYYKKALVLNEENPAVYYNISAIYNLTGKQELAEEYLAKAKELQASITGQKKRE